MEEQIKKGVTIVTVKELVPIFKIDENGNKEQGNNIQVIRFEENGYEIVGMIGLYNVGDRVIMIAPDYCLPDIKLFESYTKPEGNPKKSRLGGSNRVRAVKFNFYKEDGQKVFSNGILYPIQEVRDYFVNTGKLLDHQDISDAEDFLDKHLGIYKKEEEVVDNDSLGGLPTGLRKTDETNINNINRIVENKITEEKSVPMIATLKIDGSSTTIYQNAEDSGITSRSLRRKLYIESYPGLTPKFKDYAELVPGMKVERKGAKKFKSGLLVNTLESISEHKVTFLEDDSELHPRALGIAGYVDNLSNFYTEAEVEEKFTLETTISSNPHVKLGYPILEVLRKSGKEIAIRCEIYGGKLKGSGNSNNPHVKCEPSISIYGIDDYSTGVSIPYPMREVITILEELGLINLLVPIVYQGDITAYSDIEKISEEYFNENLVEGLVWRTYNDASISTKYMNLTYDSKK